MQKARRQDYSLRPLVGVRFQVLFHSSIRSTFHLSLTVLVLYRSLESYLALPDGTGRFRQDFSGPALLRILHVLLNFYLRSFHALWLHFPEDSIWWVFLKVVLQPQSCTQLWFGLFPVRSPLLGESFVIFFSSGYLDVSVLRVGSLSSAMSST